MQHKQCLRISFKDDTGYEEGGHTAGVFRQQDF